MLGLGLGGYEPDLHRDTAVAFCIQARENELFSPLHQHRRSQLILALHGAITCGVGNAMWMVPLQYAVWIPGEIPHSNHTTVGVQLCFLLIEPQAVIMPDRYCTLEIASLYRKLILALASEADAQRLEPATQRLTQVLFDELPQQPQKQMQLPVSGHPKIRRMVAAMTREPVQW